jgi:signal transduction histidine kinase
VTEDRGRARLSVSDDGPGIDEAEAANIFERFYRVDGAQASGSGLGLAIARELVRLMGGALELERSEGRTTFAVTLPAAALSVESATKTPAQVAI